MPLVRSLAAKSLALIACLHLIGGHWLALQTVAWVDMFVENQRSDSLLEALGKTFDGEHPCNLCHTVEKGQQDEGDQQPTLLISQLIAILPAVNPLPPVISTDLFYFSTSDELSSIRLTLPTPPPWQS